MPGETAVPSVAPSASPTVSPTRTSPAAPPPPASPPASPPPLSEEDIYHACDLDLSGALNTTELCCARNACLEIGGASASTACAGLLESVPVEVCQGTLPDNLDENNDGELSQNELFADEPAALTSSDESGVPIWIYIIAAVGGACACCWFFAIAAFLRKKKKKGGPVGDVRVGMFEALRSPRRSPGKSPTPRTHDAESAAIARRQQKTPPALAAVGKKDSWLTNLKKPRPKATFAPGTGDSPSGERQGGGARGFLKDRAGLTRSGMGNLSGTSRKTVTAFTAIPGSPAHLTQTSAVERQTGNGHAKLSESSVGRARSRSRDQQREHASLQASIGAARPARRSPGARNFLGRTSSLQEDSGCRSTGLAERSDNSMVLMTTMAI